MTPNERAVEAVARALWRNEKWVAWDDVAPAYQAPFLAAAATLVAQITPLLTADLQAAEAATPSARWKANGEPDPHGSRYNCERAALAKGHLTDDEIANGVFMADRSDLDLIGWQTAAKDRIRWLSRALGAAEAEKRQAVERKRFPVLSGEGAKVDWQLVADHGEQAHQNHGQSVARLAERGGLSWCELFAVLHNRPWAKMDTNEAMIACRSLEARYLAAIRTGAKP